MAKEGRSGKEPLGSDQKPQPESRSKLKSALAFITHFPQKLRRVSSSLRAGQQHSSDNQPATQSRTSETAMSTRNGSTTGAGSAVATAPRPLETLPQGQHHGSSSAAVGAPALSQPSGLKENVPPVDALVATVSRLSLADNASSTSSKNLAIQPPNPPGRTEEERQMHQRFTDEALDMARLALRTNETPVGCVLVHNGTVIAKGMNATNVTRNGTRHAEFMALVALLSRTSKDAKGTTAANGGRSMVSLQGEDVDSSDSDENPSTRGHLYPYGQKLYPVEAVDKSIVRECVLYVTVEPCVMCASLLRQFGIKKVYFGAVNDKFGGTGGVFNIHKNSSPMDSESDTPRGDGGSIEPGYEVEGGWGRDEAVGLLRRFYVQENGRAPVPRKKEGRAARLAALERDANGTSTPESGELVTAPESIADGEESSRVGEAEDKPDEKAEEKLGEKTAEIST
ncbi:related to TAD2 - tRNA-specific adenosine deaminase 2 [Cephalotrichum gorgonifer]|uniref:Related to TAD2 - tRNA-specific adenosine deaminase 2 n=1 Tax=Cephalotrichum gorgonifer TaxID=2041049 RepID=A0AAE8SWF2_9PEZI|nr:related to TAD2 - tRNA-specific adenosine deaminase 2 [Cephalotrichum gorgonifer]